MRGFEKLKVLDLFSGIGGFSLGLEMAGIETVAFCEIKKSCWARLERHWPNVPIFSDIKELTYERLQNKGIEPNVICGGFPCQDISTIGKRKGIDGERSGLWSEFLRLISGVRPKYAILENSSNLLRGDNGSWIRKLFGELAKIGYDAEWHIISASSFGADHIRERCWILAYPAGNSIKSPIYKGIQKYRFFERQPRGKDWEPTPGTHWATDKPGFIEMDDGISSWVVDVSGYGNSVIPQIPESIGIAIIDYENNRKRLDNRCH